MTEPSGHAGIDAGGSCWKIALLRDGLQTDWMALGDIDRLAVRIHEWRPARVAVTGAGAATVCDTLGAGVCATVSEFDAWGAGAPVLAARTGRPLPDSFLLVSVGTGTAFLRVARGSVERVGGSTLGGATLHGLAALLGCGDSFDEVATLAESGDRTRVDLTVGDLYGSAECPLPAHLPAAAFGKVASSDPADLASALVHMIGETLGTLCVTLAQRHGVFTVALGGGTLAGNGPLATVLSRVVAHHVERVELLQDGAFCGAVGAAAWSVDP